MAENFQAKTLLEMSQMEIPTDADIASRQIQAAREADQADHAQISGADRSATMQQAQQNPSTPADLGQAQQQIQG
jgi:hypothetical protein